MKAIGIQEETNLEELIHKSQEGFGHITKQELWLDSNDKNDVVTIFGQAARDKLLSFGLIEQIDDGLYRLTEKGWNFESFKKEKELYQRERYVKNNAYW